MLSVFMTPWQKPTACHCAIRRGGAARHFARAGAAYGCGASRQFGEVVRRSRSRPACAAPRRSLAVCAKCSKWPKRMKLGATRVTTAAVSIVSRRTGSGEPITAQRARGRDAEARASPRSRGTRGSTSAAPRGRRPCASTASGRLPLSWISSGPAGVSDSRRAAGRGRRRAGRPRRRTGGRCRRWRSGRMPRRERVAGEHLRAPRLGCAASPPGRARRAAQSLRATQCGSGRPAAGGRAVQKSRRRGRAGSRCSRQRGASAVTRASGACHGQFIVVAPTGAWSAWGNHAMQPRVRGFVILAAAAANSAQSSHDAGPDAGSAAADLVADRRSRRGTTRDTEIVSRRVEGDIHRYTYARCRSARAPGGAGARPARAGVQRPRRARWPGTATATSSSTTASPAAAACAHHQPAPVSGADRLDRQPRRRPGAVLRPDLPAAGRRRSGAAARR